MREKLFVVAGLLLVPGLMPSQAANLLVNGSFETPLVPVGGFTNFASGSTLITGWTVVGAGTSIVSGSFSQECCKFPAEDGNQWLDLTGDGLNTAAGVEQTVTTVPGTDYTLSFFVGNTNDPHGIFGTTSSVKVFLGGPSGTLLDTVTNNSPTTGIQVWREFFEHFQATGTSTTIAFINNDPGNDNTNGLDNVDLEGTGTVGTVPEPTTLSLIGAGLLGFSFVRHRKVRSRRAS